MANLAIVMTVVVLFQLLLSLYQIRYYQGFMASLVKKYQKTEDYKLVSEVTKSSLSSKILVLIYDKEKVIVEAHYLNGISIFSKFKPCQELIGRRLDSRLLSLVKGDKKSPRGLAALVAKYQ